MLKLFQNSSDAAWSTQPCFSNSVMSVSWVLILAWEVPGAMAGVAPRGGREEKRGKP